jgi:exonuclease-1
MALLRDGDRQKAQVFFQRAVDVTPLMASQLIRALNAEGVECIVAPYEADAQLAFLSISGYVDAVISEDSDLLAYGCRHVSVTLLSHPPSQTLTVLCQVIFKLNKEGNGEEINMNRLGETTSPSFHNFTHAMFRQVCILAGCDYLPSIPGMGVKKAHGLVKKYGSAEKVFDISFL